jgi:hypothetical protein
MRKSRLAKGAYATRRLNPTAVTEYVGGPPFPGAGWTWTTNSAASGKRVFSPLANAHCVGRAGSGALVVMSVSSKTVGEII